MPPISSGRNIKEFSFILKEMEKRKKKKVGKGKRDLDSREGAKIPAPADLKLALRRFLKYSTETSCNLIDSILVRDLQNEELGESQSFSSLL